MSSGNTLRVCILGAGGIARVHAQGWTSFPEKAEIYAFSDVMTDRAQAMSDTYTGGKAKVFGSIDEAVADPNVDVIDICLPHHLHTEAVLKAAEAGKAILCEKPLTTTLADAAKIRDTVSRTGVIFSGAHNNLFTPNVLEARRMIETGYIGRTFMIRSIETFQSKRWNPWDSSANKAGGAQSGWRADLRTSGGGELLDTGYHGTYRLLSLAGGARPVEVTGFLSRFMLSHLPTEDTGHVVVRFDNGVVGEIITSWAFDVVGGRQFEVVGEYGAIAGSQTSLTHQFYNWGDDAVTKEFGKAATFTLEIGHFIDVVQNGAPNAAGIEDTIRTLQVIKGAYLSAQLGQTVTLPEDPTGQPEAKIGTQTPYSVTVPDEVLG